MSTPPRSCGKSSSSWSTRAPTTWWSTSRRSISSTRQGLGCWLAGSSGCATTTAPSNWSARRTRSSRFSGSPDSPRCSRSTTPSMTRSRDRVVTTNPVDETPVSGDWVGDDAVGKATVRLAFPPQARLLGTIRLVAGIDEEGIEDLKVAVSETCAVAVADLARAGLSSPIELDLIEDGERFGVEIRDRAPVDGRKLGGFDMDDLDDRQFGLALVGALVDDLDSAPLEDGGHRTSFWVRGPAGTAE